jgi:16S rRNA C967 or C1407 C5-methylase (RsmB/RsmF family)/NOL1/NOP2/fmu family ribosome biogenesis protein
MMVPEFRREAALMQPVPEAFSRRMADWLGTEWPLLRDALDGQAERAVRLHRVARNGSAPPASGLPVENPPAKGLSPPSTARTAAGWAVAQEPLPVPETVLGELGDPVPWLPDAFYVSPHTRLGISVYHETGAYYLQEPSAMAVAAAVDARPGERILDLCAAPGGKAGAIGRNLGVNGILVANEIDRDRCRVLAQNMERLGLPAIVLNERPEVLADALPAWFDAVLVDAPCSGEGMFRKDEGARMAWSPAAPEGCAARQRRILEAAVRLVRPGGRLVYSTCTFNPVENEQVVAWALDSLPVQLEPLPDWPGWQPGRPDWADGRADLLHARRLWPHQARGEGHFVARFRVLAKKDVQPERRTKQVPPLSRGMSRDIMRALEETWLQPGTVEHWLAWGTLREFADGHVTWLPNGAPVLRNLRVLRAGISVARRHGQRWLPHHALAMAVAAGFTQRPLPVGEAEALRWLAGEALAAGGLQGGVWLHLEGLPLGFGRAVGDRINNLVPKGIRRRDLELLPRG